ncbi:hypothetical protein ACFQ3S_18580 [Mucilaginibacter terrae]|uniref:hypothetical protein n=1 Tax=Mucilaginibacter terrae TaxID=1955052 RepID=UPI00362F1ADA
MRKHLLLFVLLVTATLTYAQSETETLEWLNIKKTEITLGSSYSSTVSSYSTVKLLLTNETMRLENDKGAWTEGNWSSIKEVKNENNYVKIIYNFNYDNKPTIIGLYISDSAIKEKYIKAVKHMATLKGAKMIDSDLF